MKKNGLFNQKINRVAVGLGMLGMIFSLSACNLNPEPIEIDRTFELETTTDSSQTQPEVTQGNTDETTESSREGETISENNTETTTVKETTTEETTTLTGRDAYFLSDKSAFSTLPAFKKGTYVDHVDKLYMEVLQFKSVSKEEFDEYAKAIVDAGKYTVNSKETNRVYLENKSSEMCITLIFHDGIMLVEAGRNYWDIITYAEEATTQETKPVETKDARYQYFDSEQYTFYNVPYVTFGSFSGYEAVDNGGVLTFTEVNKADADGYNDSLERNGFMNTGSFGNDSYYANEQYIITITYNDSTLIIKSVKNQY